MEDFELPIQNLDAIDIVAKQHDGTIDLVVVCSGPLDGSIETLSRLERKVRGYLAEIQNPSFREEFGLVPPREARVIVACEHAVSALALGMIESLAREAGTQGVEVHHVVSLA
ncbi:hypothetical protein [Ideonella sp. BN130291]|uniref:hypothetical protein n=1 Tax=Ideonella sp. BN130291 TaxID=3112940 RepID=UPI002E254E60|nr:hypothetical protein [Ideonella sp. BN130291]